MTGFPVTGPTAGTAFVALQMILDFDRCGSTPLLKPDVTRVGISCKDSQFVQNIQQLLYVMIPMQPPTEESIKQWQKEQMEAQGRAPPPPPPG